MEVMIILSLILFVHHIEFSVAIDMLECPGRQHVIDVAVNGTSDSSCLESSNMACSNITMALKYLAHNNCTVLRIGPGIYTLKQVITISRVNNVRMVGNGEKNTIIRCHPSSPSGVEVSFSENVTIELLSFENCGGNVVEYEQYWFQATLTFLFCSNVTLERVTVNSSNGTGLLLLTIYKRLTINNCVISNSATNRLPAAKIARWKEYIFGGGIVVYNVAITAVINNSDIIGNNITTHESTIDCGNNIGGGVTLLQVSLVIIDSCTLANNSRGITFNYLLVSQIIVKNTVIVSNKNHSIVGLDFSYFSNISFINTNISDFLLTASRNLQTPITHSQPNGYIIDYGQSCNISVADSNVTVMEINNKCSYTHDSFRGTCSNDSKYDHTGHCPVPYSKCTGVLCNCSDNHSGRLCGMCSDGYSVAVNSPYLSCVFCNATDVLKGWLALIGLEFVPLTVMVSIIAILNVNLNQGSLNAYVLFCQILTISFPSVGYPSWVVTGISSYIDLNKFNSFLFPFSIWNLDFISVLSQHKIKTTYIDPIENAYYFVSVGFPMCLWSSATPVGVISFWYIIVLYPLVLAMMVYMLISLYGNGYKCIVYLFRPIHRLLARFWRIFNIQPSLVHTIASIYTLCFTQLAAISLKLLHPTRYTDESGKTSVVCFYEGTQQYFSGWHILPALAAIIVLCGLLTFTLYLSLYPLPWLQQLINKLSFKKDLLISITDVFTAPYKDGTNHSWDYRHFAGINFLLRLLIMAFYYVPQSKHTLSVVPLLEVILCLFYVCLLLVFRPYKRFAHIITEVTLFLCLALLSCSPFYNVSSNNTVYYMHFVLPATGLALTMAISYCLVWAFKKLRYGYRYLSPKKPLSYYTPLDGSINNNIYIQSRSSTKHGDNDDENGILYADRVLYPNQYTAVSSNNDHQPATNDHTIRSVVVNTNTRNANYKTL